MKVRSSLTLGEMDALERRIKAAIVARNKRGDVEVTIVEAIDEAALWSEPFGSLAPLPPSASFEQLVARAPGFVCAVASETGFRFEGVGTIFWAKLEQALGLAISQTQRQALARAFELLADRYKLARPSESAFSAHFSIIAWPIANALLPVDLVGPVTRLLARGPVRALPARGRAPDFQSLRAWASAAEGARLADWLRFEGPTTRVLTALLTENRDQILPEASYRRIEKTLQSQPEVLSDVRSARARGRDARRPSSEVRTPGRFAVSIANKVASLWVSWPPLPRALFDEAISVARAKSWRPRLWGVGPSPPPQTMLGEGRLNVALVAPPSGESVAYPDAEATFGAGSDIASALASRTVEWSSCLIFEPNDERTQGEQRFAPLTGGDGLVWLASTSGSDFDGLRRLGAVCGYRLFEANLDTPADRAILVGEHLLSEQRRLLLARHPSDAITAPQATVRAQRPFLLFAERQPGSDDIGEVRTLASGLHTATLAGTPGTATMRVEPVPPPPTAPIELLLFERDTAFEALLEGRLQVRVDSRLPLTDVPCHAALEIDGVLLACGSDRLPSLPAAVPKSSALFAPLHEDAVRGKLLASGRGVLTLTVGRSVSMQVPLQRAPASVDWTGEHPTLIGSEMATVLAAASARSPHRFTPIASVSIPARGAEAFGLVLADGRIADPVQILMSQSFDLGDLSASFGADVGSRRRFDDGQGVAEIARARIAWARGLCASLSAIGARTRVVRQFDEPLLIALCGNEWLRAEQETEVDAGTDPHAALWWVALDRGLFMLPERATDDEAGVFAQAFRKHALLRDPDWPADDGEPADGAMDNALNDAFSEALRTLHSRAALLSAHEDDEDWNSPHELWIGAAKEANRLIRRSRLVDLIAPREGARALGRKSYQGLTIPELAEDLSAWTSEWALARGQLSAEDAGRSLQLWLSPAACDDADAAVRIVARDPFVARAVRYAALRLGA